MDCIAFRQAVRISVLLWWTISCPESSPCTSSMTWKAPPIRDGLPLRRERRPSPLTKTWTSSRTCLMACCWKQKTTMLCARLYRGTAWWVTEMWRVCIDCLLKYWALKCMENGLASSNSTPPLYIVVILLHKRYKKKWNFSTYSINVKKYQRLFRFI